MAEKSMDIKCKKSPSDIMRPLLYGESGMVMVAAMMVLALLSLLAVSGIGTATLEVQIAAQDRNAKQAFYLAESGMEVAKFEILRGWGKGVGSGAAPNFQVDLDANDMPDETQASSSANSAWSDGKWEKFSLQDSTGRKYEITSNTLSGSVYTITCTPIGGHTEIPADGSYRIFYQKEEVDLLEFSGTGIMLSSSQYQFSPPTTWTDHIWDGYALKDSGGSYFPIQHNLANVITIDTSSGTPTGNDFEIIRAVGSVNKFTIYDDPAFISAPNLNWTTSYNFSSGDGTWYLKDSNDAIFPITGQTYDPVDDTFELTVVGEPESGGFQIVTNPWSAYLNAQTTKTISFTFATPSGIGYGSSEVTIAEPSPGELEITASSTGTNIKSIRMDGSISTSGKVLLTNWRQVK